MVHPPSSCQLTFQSRKPPHRRLIESLKAPVASLSLEAESPGEGSCASTHGDPEEREAVSYGVESSVRSIPERAAQQHTSDKGGSPAGRLTIVGVPSSVVSPSSSHLTKRDVELELEEEREMRFVTHTHP